MKLHLGAHAADRARSRHNSIALIGVHGNQMMNFFPNDLRAGNRIESCHTMTAASGVDFSFAPKPCMMLGIKLVYLSPDLKVERNPIAAHEKHPRYAIVLMEVISFAQTGS